MKCFVIAAALTVPMAAAAITPTPSGRVSGSTVVVNASAGDQTDPHVSGEIAAYTDGDPSTTSSIRYFDFTTGVDSPVPQSPGSRDLLSDVFNNRISFSRVASDRTACMV